jgi:hypothetical protein
MAKEDEELRNNEEEFNRAYTLLMSARHSRTIAFSRGFRFPAPAIFLSPIPDLFPFPSFFANRRARRESLVFPDHRLRVRADR